jgi:hypothetical protein
MKEICKNCNEFYLIYDKYVLVDKQRTYIQFSIYVMMKVT